MPKHAFRFPIEVQQAVRNHVNAAIERVPGHRFSQEATYTSALMSQLAGTAYQGEHGSVTFETTVFDDRGPGTAESIYGADHAITALITNGELTIEKAILVQAKLGNISSLRGQELIGLRDQIGKMKQIVGAPKVMQILEADGRRQPQIVSGNRVLENVAYRAMDLDDYFVARVMTTLDGATDQRALDAVRDSSMSRIRMIAKLAPGRQSKPSAVKPDLVA